MVSFGDVVLVKFPFSNLESSKKRPGLVLAQIELSSEIQLVIIAMITSKLDTLKLKGDVKLKRWKETGLLHPSIVRISKIATLDSEIIQRKMGQIQKEDLAAIRLNFKKIFKDLIARS